VNGSEEMNERMEMKKDSLDKERESNEGQGENASKRVTKGPKRKRVTKVRDCSTETETASCKENAIAIA
jgi:hypothetical protein